MELLSYPPLSKKESELIRSLLNSQIGKRGLFQNSFTVENKKAVKYYLTILYGLNKVPRAGLEPALAFKYQLDFKSNASTNSATEAKNVTSLFLTT